MAVKNENEITVKVICSKEDLEKCLNARGFNCIQTFNMKDCYFVPSEMDLSVMSVRDILSKCVIVRNISYDDFSEKKITYKIKDIDSNGDILSQQSINCVINNIDEAKALLNAIGYRELMNIEENNTVYSDGKIELAVKDVKNGCLLIEIETDEKSGLCTVDDLKNAINKLDLPIEENQYFVKKAEIELEKVLR